MTEKGLRWSTLLLAGLPLLGMKPFIVACILWVFLLLLHRLQHGRGNEINPKELIALCGLYLFMCISVLLSENKADSWKYTETAAALLVFPATLFGCAPSKAHIEREQLTTVFILCALILGSFVNLSILLNGLNPFLSESAPYRSAFAEVSWISHPLYASYIFAIGFLFALDRSVHHKSMRGWWALTCILLLLFTILCASRMPLIGIAIGSFYYLYRSVKSNKTIISAASVLVIIAISMANPTSNERIHQFYKTSLNIPTAEDQNSVNIRIGIMYCSLELLKNNWLLGVGVGQSYQELTECTTELDSIAFSHTPVDTHNQALHYWLEYGILGLMLFLLLISYSMIRSWQRQDHLHFVVLLLMIICMMTENLLSRQIGVILFAYWNTILLYTGTNRIKSTSVPIQ